MNLKEDDIVSAIALVVDDVEPGEAPMVDGPLDAPSTETPVTLQAPDETAAAEADGADEVVEDQ
jgi:hypothetical protein